MCLFDTGVFIYVLIFFFYIIIYLFKVGTNSCIYTHDITVWGKTILFDLVQGTPEGTMEIGCIFDPLCSNGFFLPV